MCVGYILYFVCYNTQLPCGTYTTEVTAQYVDHSQDKPDYSQMFSVVLA